MVAELHARLLAAEGRLEEEQAAGDALAARLRDKSRRADALSAASSPRPLGHDARQPAAGAQQPGPEPAGAQL
eukprot:gene521-53834_t